MSLPTQALTLLDQDHILKTSFNPAYFLVTPSANIVSVGARASANELEHIHSVHISTQSHLLAETTARFHVQVPGSLGKLLSANLSHQHTRLVLLQAI